MVPAIKSGLTIVQSLFALVASVASSYPSYICGYGAIKMTMSAIAIVRRLVPTVRVMVKLEVSFPEYALQLGDVTSVMDGCIHVKGAVNFSHGTERNSDKYIKLCNFRGTYERV